MALSISHRGAGYLEPENTLRGIRKAIELKADYTEVDVRLTKDGKLAVIHDETVDRTTNGRGLAREKTLRELQKLDAGKGDRIPALEEVLTEAKGRIKLLVELKEEGLEQQAVDAIEKSGFKDAVIISFLAQPLRKVRQISKLKTGLIFLGPDWNVELAAKLGASLALTNFHYTDRGLVVKAHNAGLEVFTGNCDSEYDVRIMKAIGADAISSNRPDMVVRVLSK